MAGRSCDGQAMTGSNPASTIIAPLRPSAARRAMRSLAGPFRRAGSWSGGPAPDPPSPCRHRARCRNRPTLSPKREQLVGHLVGRAPDHQVVEDAIEVDGVVGRVRVFLEEIAAAALEKFGEQLAVVEAIRTLRPERVGLRLRKIVGDEDGFGDAPVGRISRPAGARATFGVFRPVGRDPFGQQKIRRDRRTSRARPPR